MAAKPQRPQDTRQSESSRLGQPEEERARTQHKLRATVGTWRALQRAATRNGCDVATLVERWAALGCPLPALGAE